MDGPPSGRPGALERLGLVGAAGFEPAISWTQTTRDNQASLRPDWEKQAIYR